MDSIIRLKEDKQKLEYEIKKLVETFYKEYKSDIIINEIRIRVLKEGWAEIDLDIYIK